MAVSPAQVYGKARAYMDALCKLPRSQYAAAPSGHYGRDYNTLRKLAQEALRDSHLYALDKKDGLKCIELKTGAIKWDGVHVTPKERNPQASLVWAGQQALILNTPGELVLAQLTPARYRQLGKLQVIERMWAHPGYAEGCVFVRNDQEIVCVPLVAAAGI